MWSKYADEKFYMNTGVCVYAAHYVAPPLLILSEMRLNRYFILKREGVGSWLSNSSVWYGRYSKAWTSTARCAPY